MEDFSIRLDDLPDEILIYIFEKLYNDEVLYSLMGVNQRLNQIVQDQIFTGDLCLLRYGSYDDSIIPLPDSTLERCCLKILPKIGHRIQSLFLERTSIERVLHATNYPNLNNLALYDINSTVAMSLFGVTSTFLVPLSDDKNPLNQLKNQISSLFININHEDESLSSGVIYPLIFLFEDILATFPNLRCLKLNPNASFDDIRDFFYAPVTCLYSTLLELHISIREMDDCLAILDICFDQLRILKVNLFEIHDRFDGEIKSKKPYPNLQIFSLSCGENVTSFDQTIVPVLRRMFNLEELHLNIVVECDKKFLDGDTLKNDIIIYMPRLYKFTYNICSIINHSYQTNFPLNEQIEKTFEDFFNNQTCISIDHFQEEERSQCHIYSYPYRWKFYNNITNHFSGGLFSSVIEVSLHDEHPFEYEFFIRIAQSFPLMKKLIINNRKAQNNKQLIESNDDNEISSIIQYPNLTRIDLFDAHDDYLELFLFNTKISLPNNLHISINYQSLQRVTHYFTRYTARNNCAKLAALYFYQSNQIDEHFKNYFPHTCIRCPSDFLSIK